MVETEPLLSLIARKYIHGRLTVDAVLLNHMEHNPVVSVTPISSRMGRSPIARRIMIAIRLCRPLFIIAAAIVMQPSIRNDMS